MDQAEAERQVVAAVDRYEEVAASMDRGGRPETGQRAAVKAVGRAIQLLSFVLKRAAASGVTLERLSELTAWEPAVVREVLEQQPEAIARVTPAGLDADAVAHAAAGSEASLRLHTLTEAILADVDDQDRTPAAADLDELHERLESEWRAWRSRLRGSLD